MEIRYRYQGVPRFRISQPWYEHTSWEPWDEDRVSWLLANRNRRLIVQALAHGPLTLDELKNRLRVCLTPYLADRSGLSQDISPEALANHLHTMEYHSLIHREGDRYALNLPVLTLADKEKLRSLSDELGRGLAECLRQAGTEPDWLDPLLERVITTALEILDGAYGWETYHRWAEEYDADAHRSWAETGRAT